MNCETGRMVHRPRNFMSQTDSPSPQAQPEIAQSPHRTGQNPFHFPENP